ncbi:hypothetical protein ACT3UQ_09270 [Glutamicibacter sp. AOP12-B1-11]|uniref:hypothetical protein n=1 Tax=Glutamicibacter sp. AOP12-B1-11 TaxID=3457725 RepID=UPI0040343D43
MSKDYFTPPTVQHVQTEGGLLQVVGKVLTACGLVIGLVVLFLGGNPALLSLVPLGLLITIAGYVQQIAVATAASYLLAMNEAGSADSTEATGERPL